IVRIYYEMSGEDWKSAPSSVHLLFLSSGKRVNIELFYDQSKWSLCGSVDVENLEDLTFIFDLIGNHKSEGTRFTLKSMDNEFTCISSSSSSARFRLGPSLAWIFGELSITCQGRNRLMTPPSIFTVRIDVEEYKGELPVWREVMQFINGCQSRGIIADQRLAFPAEIVSLHSDFFLQLFFGSFSERTQEFVRMEGTSVDSLSQILLLAMAPSRFSHLFCANHDLNSLSSLLPLVDQFSFLSLLSRLSSQAETSIRSIRSCDLSICTHVMDVADFLKDNKTMISFFSRFGSSECLDLIVDVFVDRMSPILIRSISKRQATLSRSIYDRSKIRLDFGPSLHLLCSLQRLLS
ncbi:hypothetical protein PFISCL1PPCAC_20113, partial [Pristionchus fissidentatus]